MMVFCILGDARAYQSKSPALFTRILDRVGIPGGYLPFKVAPERVGEAVHSLRVLNIAGANVTVPYKEAVMPHLDVLSEGANIIGSVNTIVPSGDTLKGYNTNAIGFMNALRDAGFDPAGKSALVFGAGGAAKAVTFILNWLRADTIMVAGRSEDKSRLTAERIHGEFIRFQALKEMAVTADIVVNATPASDPDESAELAAVAGAMQVDGCGLVFDLNYGRKQNFWQEAAVRMKVPFVDGLSTLAHQAAKTFSLWTRIEVDPAEILKDLQGR
jgi:shikimate dehydrogenase